MTYVVGLTGGIGTGKSTVEAKFSALKNAVIIDADKITRELQEIGEAGYVFIHKEFGNRILNLDGSLNREKLRTLVFSDKQAKKQLEGIMIPLIYHEIKKKIEAYANLYQNDHAWPEYVILSAATLLENKPFLELVDVVLVVEASVEKQVERVMKRNSMSREDVMKIVDAQYPSYYRMMQAHYVIQNNGAHEELDPIIAKIDNLFVEDARKKMSKIKNLN